MPSQASELFEGILCSAGSLVVTCEWCDRTHFATSDPNPYDDGELEDLLAKAKKEPDKYVNHEAYDTVSWGHIAGKATVLDCPCNKVAEVEELVWLTRRLILEYLERRTAAQLEAAKDDAASVEQAKKIVR